MEVLRIEVRTECEVSIFQADRPWMRWGGQDGEHRVAFRGDRPASVINC